MYTDLPPLERAQGCRSARPPGQASPLCQRPAPWQRLARRPPLGCWHAAARSKQWPLRNDVETKYNSCKPRKHWTDWVCSGPSGCRHLVDSRREGRRAPGRLAEGRLRVARQAKCGSHNAGQGPNRTGASGEPGAADGARGHARRGGQACLLQQRFHRLLVPAGAKEGAGASWHQILTERQRDVRCHSF